MTRRAHQYEMERMERALKRAHKAVHAMTDPGSRVTLAGLRGLAADLMEASRLLDGVTQSPFLAEDSTEKMRVVEP